MTGRTVIQVSASSLMTIKQAAEYAPALGERFLRRLLDERRIPLIKIGGRVFVDRNDLDALAVRSRIEPDDRRS